MRDNKGKFVKGHKFIGAISKKWKPICGNLKPEKKPQIMEHHIYGELKFDWSIKK